MVRGRNECPPGWKIRCIKVVRVGSVGVVVGGGNGVYVEMVGKNRG